MGYVSDKKIILIMLLVKFKRSFKSKLDLDGNKIKVSANLRKFPKFCSNLKCYNILRHFLLQLEKECY